MIKKDTAIMDSNSLENIFKENMWIINQLYKLLVLIVFIGGPLTALFVLLLTFTSQNTSIITSVIILLSLVISFKLGPSPFFLVNCSWIYFRFDKCGIWLIVVSYLLAIAILGLQLAADKILAPGND
jgi:hypothetical protein